jgi:integrase
MRERSEGLAAADPEHYVFRSCELGHFDATRPMKNWRTAWRSLTKEAGLRGLRFHDLRHTAITELSERDTSDMTIMSIAGHVSWRMLEHYSHIRLEAKRKALDALAGPEKAVTAQSTSHSQKKTSAESTKLLM